MKHNLITYIILILVILLFIGTIYEICWGGEFAGKVYLHNIESWYQFKEEEVMSVDEHWVSLYHQGKGITWSCLDGSHKREDVIFYKEDNNEICSICNGNHHKYAHLDPVGRPN